MLSNAQLDTSKNVITHTVTLCALYEWGQMILVLYACVCLKAWYLKLEDIGMTIKFHIHVMLWLLCCRIKAFTVYQRLLSLILSYTHRCRWDCKDGNSVCHLYYSSISEGWTFQFKALAILESWGDLDIVLSHLYTGVCHSQQWHHGSNVTYPFKNVEHCFICNSSFTSLLLFRQAILNFYYHFVISVAL